MSTEKKCTLPTLEQLKKNLQERNINLSHQRLKVLEYLTSHNTHPSTEEIYEALHQDIPTLSKSTVYNTLKVLVEAGVVRELMIENNEARYDIITDFHGHFKCERCGDIHNFSIRLDDLAYKGLGSYLIKQRDVYFKGVCPDCLENKTISQEDL